MVFKDCDKNNGMKKESKIEVKSRYEIELWYSSDNLSDEARIKKEEKLYKGNDLVTRVLNNFHVPFIITLASDFYHDEPALYNIVHYDKYGKGYTVYGHGFFNSYGDMVLNMLIHYGVIPCSIEEARTIGEKI